MLRRSQGLSSRKHEAVSAILESRTMIAAFRKHIFEDTEDVGMRFVEEARKIHDGLVEERPIHGQANIDDARALIEEGIAILPIPALPDDFN